MYRITEDELTDLDKAIELQRAVIAGLAVDVAMAEERLHDADNEYDNALEDLHYMEALKAENRERRCLK